MSKIKISLLLLLFVSVVLLCTAAVWASPNPSAKPSYNVIVEDKLADSTVGRAQGVTYGTDGGKPAATFGTPDSEIEYAPKYFAQKSGMIAFDFMLPERIPADRKNSWCLFSDVGSGGAHLGNIVVLWPKEEKTLDFGIFDSAAFHWCKSTTTEWVPGHWYHLALTYGPSGMSLAIDGRPEAMDSWSGGLADTFKTIGYHDAFMDSPHMAVSDFRTYRMDMDGVWVSPEAFSPNGDGVDDTCKITYDLENNADVSISVVDKNGRLLKNLLNSEKESTGEHSFFWNGSGLSDGKYTVRAIMQRGENSRTFEQPVRIDTRWRWKETAGVDKTFFPIGVWFFAEGDASYIHQFMSDSVKAKEYYDYTMQDLARLGVNFAVMNWTPREHWSMALDAAKKNGIRCVMHLDKVSGIVGSGPIGDWERLCDQVLEMVKDVRNRPEVAGYYIVDEPLPTPEMARNITLARKAIETVDPTHTGFSCMMPGVNYEYLIQRVGYQAVVVDNYVISKAWNGDFKPYIDQLDRAERTAGNRPLWIILQAFGSRNWGPMPTPEAIRAQVWLAAAYGAKGIIYFIYQSTTGVQGEWLQGLVGMDLKPTGDQWTEVRKIDSDLKKIAPTLLSLKPSNGKIGLEAGLVCRAFTGTKGKHYLIVVNPDTKKAVSINWTLSKATDALTGETVSNNLFLPAGGGKLLEVHD